MKKIIIPLLIILSACSTSETTKDSKRNLSSSEEEFSWIEQLDFDKKSEETYRADRDEFKLSNSDESSYALVKESLAVLSPERLDSALSKADDPLIQINVKCYQNKFDEAFAIADQVYARYKNNTSYWNQIGTCYFLRNDYSKAILFYNKSRDLDKKFVPPLNNLGVVYQKQGHYQKALAAFKLASDTNKFSVTPTYNLANLYLRFGTVGKALPIFNGLLKRSPKDVEVISALASAHLIKGDYQEAVAHYSKLDSREHRRPSVGLNYALALKMLNKTDEARSILGNVSTPSAGISEYAQKVEKFIRE